MGRLTTGAVVLRDVGELRDAAEGVVARLEAAIGGALAGAEIHHVGATSLPGGETKGDVDVNVRVGAAGFAGAVETLRARFTVAQPENWTPVFASFSAEGYELPLGIQVTVIGSEADFLLELRDAMRADPELRRRYDEVKRAAAASGPEAYWQAKDRFLAALPHTRPSAGSAPP